MPAELSPAFFVKALTALRSDEQAEDVKRFFRPDPHAGSDDNQILGVGIGKIFPVAKGFERMPLKDVETLLEDPHYEVRMGAVSIMDYQARAKSLTPEKREALYNLYLRRHDRINNWDLVDRAAPHVVGQHLANKPRAPLYRLAESRNPWERRTAIVATWWFIRAGDTTDTFAIAEKLVAEPHDLVQKAVGSWIREAGKKAPAALTAFLKKHAPAMPRAMLRMAVEKLDAGERGRFLSLNKAR